MKPFYANIDTRKSEEKAIPQYLKKYREAAKTLLEQKIEAVKIPPKTLFTACSYMFNLLLVYSLNFDLLLKQVF